MDQFQVFIAIIKALVILFIFQISILSIFSFLFRLFLLTKLNLHLPFVCPMIKTQTIGHNHPKISSQIYLEINQNL